MEGPLLTKSEHIKTDGDSSSNDEHNVNITITDDSSSTPREAEAVERCIPSCTGEMEWCCFIEFVLNIVQIVAAFVVVNRAKDEHPETSFLIWIIGYTCGCVAILLIQFINCVSSSYDVIMDFVTEIFEYFFVGWVLLFLWIYHSSSSSLYDNTQHFWLCMAFLAFTCIRYIPAHLIFSAICFIFVVIIWICAAVLGTTPNMFVYVAFLTIVIGILKVVQEVLELHL
ncbi:hypothetical protein ISN44_As06g037250 [Arabidopsis suecica]|uniref:Transmembrane protein n=1 Tax=Arabidopsis suecica TaxID=45249 RepID=A0A8T2CJ92_ARASU|nr:hypothetical protein ISN44_As06g037250 [Arabidopsis suecica]